MIARAAIPLLSLFVGASVVACAALAGIPDRTLVGDDAATAQPDSSFPDTSLPDTLPSFLDTSLPDTSLLDASLPDTSLPGHDASADAGEPSPADFLISVGTLARATIVRGGVATVPVYVVWRSPELGAVTVTTGSLPTGVTADSLTIPATSGSGTLTLHASASADLTVTGTLEITGTSGHFTHTIAIPLFVQDPPGTLDATFGNGGIAAVPLVGAVANAGIGTYGLAAQPDGAIVFCGNAEDANGDFELVLGRVIANGNADPSFGSSGGVDFLNEPGDTEDVCGAVRLLSKGNLAVGGFSLRPDNVNGAHAFFAAEFNAKGQPVSGWGNGAGSFSLIFGNADSKVYDLVAEPDDSLVLAGFSGSDIALVRLSPSGATDTTFGLDGGGVAVTELEGGGAATSAALLANGDILTSVAGSSLVAARFTPKGLLESSAYGDGGYAVGPATSPSAVAAVVAQPNGGSVLTGSTPPGTSSTAIELARFDDSGQIDPSFGVHGITTTRFPAGDAIAGSIVIAPDGALIVGAVLPGAAQIVVVRYDSAGNLDTSFAGVGYAGIPANAGGAAVAIDSAGRIVIGAFTTNAPAHTASVILARFWP